ncbi:RNA polymerase sigma factor, FliA/WhiG family [Legionella oakridgensis ATCC 33761 = DSM 21215]|uniref:RNA polymerase sigma factor FliA n=2 Tax=Legionella oakridgensis TaxID=29423 RepID=W0BH03_9GAMM|nr:RNA polymerase sigma factor FliA [Legionella oakridgensis]AHE67704.1 RNA polymerase sigma factor, FliA/WhiG family [Legionella oakridgensis ATCC 33761 = DSM 21215]ETO92744.1 RNA polymerase, sigma 28 subunit, SigD/FliA/WhiG [Legionella oakridgensis RV-2-2007]KTD36963.1 flagellar biosynthesis sigma factor FliA [Legionella oakridgensis]STY20728.1 flagellar biosynthesis sigma factor FliA [Legionella longbeachae]
MNDALASDGKVEKQTQEALVKTHAYMVKRIAHHLLGRLPPSIQLDDLLQAGMLGLLEAALHYDAGKGASFETYASIRIRGHMLDEVRRNDWVPRSVYRNARMIASAVREVENRLGRDAKDHEVAEELGISLEEYHEILNDSAGGHLYAFEDLGVTDDVLLSDETVGHSTEPHISALQADRTSQLSQIIDSLPKKEQLVLSLYYEQDLNLKEIGEVLGVSESRVSQIHSQATHRIKSRLPEL